jgi:DNA-binding transcriptional LysR family regulator
VRPSASSSGSWARSFCHAPPREVRLTDAGREFLEGARRTLAELERAAAGAKRAGAGELVQLRVAYSWSVRFETLPAIGRVFRASHPDVVLITEAMWNARMLPALRSGAIDVAIALCPEVGPEFSYKAIRTEAVVALLATSHPHAGDDALALEAFRDDDLVLFPRELAPRLYDFFVSLCRRAGFEPKARVASSHSEWDLGILADAKLVALSPQSVLRARPNGVAAVVIADPPDQLQTTLVWRTDERSATNRAFRAAALEAFASERSGLAP